MKMKIINVKRYTNPFKWELFLAFTIIKANGKQVQKIYCYNNNGISIEIIKS